MIKKVIPYTDFDGNPRVEEFWFNLTKAEMMDLGLSKDGGYDKYMEQLMHSAKVGEAIEVFKKILLLAYGKKSLDASSRRALRSPQTLWRLRLTLTSTWNWQSTRTRPQSS